MQFQASHTEYYIGDSGDDNTTEVSPVEQALEPKSSPWDLVGGSSASRAAKRKLAKAKKLLGNTDGHDALLQQAILASMQLCLALPPDSEMHSWAALLAVHVKV